MEININEKLALAEAENHFSNRAQKMELQELQHICENDPFIQLIDALVIAKEIVRNELQKELDLLNEK